MHSGMAKGTSWAEARKNQACSLSHWHVMQQLLIHTAV